MKRVSKWFLRGAALALLLSNLFAVSAFAGDVRPRGPSLIDRVQAIVKHVIYALSDEISLPPPQPGH
jgi:hypothetical protein